MKVCAVVVTYRRPAELARCLDALEAQTVPLDAVLVVDNASGDETAALLAERSAHVEVLTLEENLGGSGGFAAGFRRAFEAGFDWAWVMDDDAAPLPDAHAALRRSFEEHRGGLTALASRLVQNDAGAGGGDPAPIGKAMFVGFAVSRSLYARVGGPREDFFIYTDDSEYCLRIAAAGGRVLEVPTSRVRHEDWKLSRDNVEVSVLGRRLLLYPRMPGWKKYYLARNRLLMGRAHSLPLLLRGLGQALVLATSTLVFCPGDVGLVLKGIRHGLAGISGKIVEPAHRP